MMMKIQKRQRWVDSSVMLLAVSTASTLRSAFGQTTTACQICANPSDAKNESKDLFWLDSVTCAQYDGLLSAVGTSQCRFLLGEEHVDLAAYCECEGTSAPNNVCRPLCDGQDVVDYSARVRFDGFGMTCGQVEQYNEVIVDASFCADSNPKVAEACCPAVATPPSPPTRAPVAAAPPPPDPTAPPTPSPVRSPTPPVTQPTNAPSPGPVRVTTPMPVAVVVNDDEEEEEPIETAVDAPLPETDAPTLAPVAATVISTPVPVVTADEDDDSTSAPASVTCRICPNAEDVMSEPDREIFWLDSATCTEYDGLISTLSPDMCADVVLNEQNVNLAAFCGCTGTESPDVCPPLCDPTGDEPYVVDDPSVNVFFDEYRMSCPQAGAYNGLIFDRENCAAATGFISSTCCTSVAPPTSPPTLRPSSSAPTPSPTSPPSTVAPSPEQTTASPDTAEATTPVDDTPTTTGGGAATATAQPAAGPPTGSTADDSSSDTSQPQQDAATSDVGPGYLSHSQLLLSAIGICAGASGQLFA